MKEIGVITLFFKDGDYKKIYRMTLFDEGERWMVRTQYGRVDDSPRGRALEALTGHFADAKSAYRHISERTKSKQRKKYVIESDNLDSENALKAIAVSARALHFAKKEQELAQKLRKFAVAEWIKPAVEAWFCLGLSCIEGPPGRGPAELAGCHLGVMLLSDIGERHDADWHSYLALQNRRS